MTSSFNEKSTITRLELHWGLVAVALVRPQLVLEISEWEHWSHLRFFLSFQLLSRSLSCDGSTLTLGECKRERDHPSSRRWLCWSCRDTPRAQDAVREHLNGYIEKLSGVQYKTWPLQQYLVNLKYLNPAVNHCWIQVLSRKEIAPPLVVHLLQK